MSAPVGQTLARLEDAWSTVKALWREAHVSEDPLHRSAPGIAPMEAHIVPLLVTLVRATEDDRAELHDSARRIRDREVGTVLDLRHAVEVSNFCRDDCRMCPMRATNLTPSERRAPALGRTLDVVPYRTPAFRLSTAPIIDAMVRAYEMGIRTVFLQGGEDPKVVPAVAEAVRYTKRELGLTDLTVVVNLGTFEDRPHLLADLAEAGTDLALVKHESVDPDVHRRVFERTLDDRVTGMIAFRKHAIEIGTGILQGLPGETDAGLARDVLFAGRIASERMVSVCPVVPAEGTPSESEGWKAGDFWKTMNLTAILRHLFPTARIPAVSVLDHPRLDTRPGNLPIRGQSQAILAGANGVTFHPKKRIEIYGTDRATVDASVTEIVARETGMQLGLEVARTVSRAAHAFEH